MAGKQAFEHIFEHPHLLVMRPLVYGLFSNYLRSASPYAHACVVFAQKQIKVQPQWQSSHTHLLGGLMTDKQGQIPSFLKLCQVAQVSLFLKLHKTAYHTLVAFILLHLLMQHRAF